MIGSERADYFLRGCAGMSDQRERKSHAEGVFDRTQRVRSGAWGNPNKLHRNIENDIPMPCLLSISNCHFAPGVVYWFKTRILRR